MSDMQICGKLKAKGVKHMSELRYVWCGDYLIPDLTLNAKAYPPLGKYGRMREQYLREHRHLLYSTMLLGGRLDEHLHEIDAAAQKRVGQLYGKIKTNERDSQKEILCCKSKKCPWQKHCADAQNGKSIHQCNDNGQ